MPFVHMSSHVITQFLQFLEEIYIGELPQTVQMAQTFSLLSLRK